MLSKPSLEIIQALSSDLDIIITHMDASKDPQRPRRMMLYALITFIDTSIRIFRTELNPHKNAFLKERTKEFITGHLFTDGRKFLGHVPLDMLLEDTLALIKHPVKKSSIEYKTLYALMPAINRFLTAKTLDDLHLTDKEMEKAITTYTWLKQIFLTTAQQTA